MYDASSVNTSIDKWYAMYDAISVDAIVALWDLDTSHDDSRESSKRDIYHLPGNAKVT